METKIRIFFFLAVIVYLVVIVHLLRRKKLNLKYTLLWLFTAIVLLVVIIFPSLMIYISRMLGIVTPINSALVLAGMFIIVILIMLTSIVSEQNRKQRILIQEVAMLDKKLRELTKKYEEEQK
ncbi:MAG: DUF2304 domain-containing protein [Clostridium sp.]|jgi:hypothetical protein|nr:DUF2304 domain-containing protein [Clostridium sp.]